MVKTEHGVSDCLMLCGSGEPMNELLGTTRIAFCIQKVLPPHNQVLSVTDFLVLRGSSIGEVARFFVVPTL